MDQEKLFANFEKIITRILVVFMGIVVIAATVELAYELFNDLTEPPGLFLGISELFDVFGLVMMVLIAIELMASIQVFLDDKRVYLEMMFLIAITAVTRKIVILDAKAVEPIILFGLAALVAALVLGYYVTKYRFQEKKQG